MRKLLLTQLLLLIAPVSTISFTSTRENLTFIPVDLISPDTSFITITFSLIPSLNESVFSGFPLLTYLQLSYNLISFISDHAFNGTRLSNLKIGHNELTSLPKFASVGSTLESLDADNNRITSLGSDEFRWVTSLKTLNLDSNLITTVASDALIYSAPVLTNLYLGQNQIDTIDADFFRNMSNLNSLTLQLNSLQTFPDFNFLPDENNLVDLSINHNRFGDLPEDALNKLSHLQVLALAGSGLTRVPDLSAQRNSLRRLYLVYNDIKVIPDDAFYGLPLTLLNIGGNKLTKFPDLSVLNTTLQTLYMSSNDFRGTPCHEILRFLLDLPALEIFDLSYNGLDIFPDITQLNNTFQRVTISNPNEMHCDCSMAWMIDLENRVDATDIRGSSTPCASPQNLRLREWSSISREELCQDNTGRTCDVDQSATSTAAPSASATVDSSGSSASESSTSESGTSVSVPPSTDGMEVTSSPPRPDPNQASVISYSVLELVTCCVVLWTTFL